MGSIFNSLVVISFLRRYLDGSLATRIKMPTPKKSIETISEIRKHCDMCHEKPPGFADD